MANKYYYLVSSLPYIAFGKTPPLAEDYFTSECQKWLTDKDLRALLNISAKNIKTDTRDRNFAGEWKEFDVSLRRTLAEARAARRVSHEERIHGLAKEVLDETTPLDMEQRFERIRWRFLEEKETDCHFDLTWLMVYYLKLKISQRLTAFNREAGRRVFEEACEVSGG